MYVKDSWYITFEFISCYNLLKLPTAYDYSLHPDTTLVTTLQGHEQEIVTLAGSIYTNVDIFKASINLPNTAGLQIPTKKHYYLVG